MGGHPESGEGNGPALSSAGLLLLFSAFVFQWETWLVLKYRCDSWS